MRLRNLGHQEEMGPVRGGARLRGRDRGLEEAGVQKGRDRDTLAEEKRETQEGRVGDWGTEGKRQ